MSFRFVKATAVAGLAVPLTLALWSASCALPDTSQRGFGSTQVRHVRDSGLSLRSFGLNEDSIYVARTVPDVIASNGLPDPYDRSLLDLGTGAEKDIATGVLGAWLLPSADGQGRSLAMTHFPSDAVIPQSLSTSSLPFIDLTFLDEVSGGKVEVKNVDSQNIKFGTTRADPIVVRTKGADGKAAFLAGPPENLWPVPEVNQIVGRDHLGLVALTGSAGGTQSISRIPFDRSPAIELAPGTLNEHPTVTDPALPPAPYAGPSTIATGGVEVKVSCPDKTTANPDPRCLLFYDRQRSGLRVPFVHDVDSGLDIELPGPLTGSFAGVVWAAPTARDTFWPTMGSSTSTRLYGWHVRDTQVASCEIPGAPSTLSFTVNAWRPGAPAAGVGGAAPAAGAQFVVVAQPTSQSSEKRATWTLIAGTAGQECHVVSQGANLISQLFYAPDGSAFAFLETDPIGVSKIYVSDGDAPTPRLVATGSYFFNIDFHDPRHLLLWHSNTDGYSLSWLDVSTTPATEHPIADRVRWDVRGSWSWLNQRWLLLADSDSMQDASYSLDLVDLETGTQKLVSRGVVDFRVPWASPPADATTLTVAYVVRSRAASSQDGLWVAHLPLGDFPP